MDEKKKIRNSISEKKRKGEVEVIQRTTTNQ
jgi:hypothetical protein